jgi:hypothetical protein
MSQEKRSSKGKRRSKAVSVLGIAGMSLAVTDGGASASVNGSATDIASQNASRQVVNFGEEEISDVSLSTFYVFDKENTRTPQAGVQEARGCGGCRGCGGGRGCGGRGCGGRGCGGRGCGGCRGCGVGGCGGCGVGWGVGGCGCCLSWGACRVC